MLGGLVGILMREGFAIVCCILTGPLLYVGFIS